MQQSIEWVFWGAFLGVASTLLAGALVVYAVARLRVALESAAVVLIVTLYAMVKIGWLVPLGTDMQARLVACMSVATTSFLLLCLASWLGGSRQRQRMFTSAALLLLALPLWLLSDRQALWLAAMAMLAGGVLGLLQGLSAVRLGDHQARIMVLAMGFMLVAIVAFNALVLAPAVAGMYVVHILAVVANTGFVLLAVGAVWLRYAYQFELSRALQHSPSYDPQTLERNAAALRDALGKNTALQMDAGTHNQPPSQLHWAAQTGVGMLVLHGAQTDATSALAMGRALAAAALGSPSRMMLFDNGTGEIKEFVPQTAA